MAGLDMPAMASVLQTVGSSMVTAIVCMAIAGQARGGVGGGRYSGRRDQHTPSYCGERSAFWCARECLRLWP